MQEETLKHVMRKLIKVLEKEEFTDIRLETVVASPGSNTYECIYSYKNLFNQREYDTIQLSI